MAICAFLKVSETRGDAFHQVRMEPPNNPSQVQVADRPDSSFIQFILAPWTMSISDLSKLATCFTSKSFEKQGGLRSLADQSSFFQNYHHFIEILDPNLSPDQYYTRSPLLFWCIISVAARRYEEDATLVSILSPCITRLLWTTISVLPHTRFTVQAMILISAWSFPTNTMSTDISFMMVSLAKSASMQLGLHRPETVQDFMRVKAHFGPQEFQSAVKVWAGCYIAAQG